MDLCKLQDRSDILSLRETLTGQRKMKDNGKHIHKYINHTIPTKKDFANIIPLPMGMAPDTSYKAKTPM